MNGRIIFLLEEASMQALLRAWLPRIFTGWVDEVHFKLVPHEGKTDLDLSIPRKLKSWRIPGDRFVIVRDSDGADCINLKARLSKLANDSDRPDTLVRIVCQELESWYLGDLAALASAFENPALNNARLRKRFAAPDAWAKPSIELKRLVPQFQKLGGARAMAAHLSPADHRSHSLQVFVNGVRALATQMGHVE